MLKIITVTNDVQRAQPLIKSLATFGWNSTVICTDWRGFGTKLIATYNFLKTNPEVDYFIFCDAHDVLVLGTPEEWDNKYPHKDKMLLSAEKGCWPDDNLRKYYEPINANGFNFVNSGLYYSPSWLFIDMMEQTMPKYEDDDQLYMTNQYLFERDDINLDTNQAFFNSHSFIADAEYGYENNRVQVNSEQPLFIHFNGCTLDEKFNQLIKI